MQQKGHIIMEGMGGFLCPPTHPMLTKSVETDLRRKPENRSLHVPGIRRGFADA